MKRLLLVPAGITLALGSVPLQAAPSPSFAHLKDTFILEYWKQYPEAAVEVGYYRYADRLSIPDRAARESQRAFCATWLKNIQAVPSSALDPQDRIDQALIVCQLEGSLWSLASFREWQWNPALYNVADTFGRILGTGYAPLEDRLRTVSRRLQKVAAYYQAARKSILDPTLEHTELALLQNKGALSLFGDSLRTQVAGSALAPAEKERLLGQAQAASAAIQEHLDWLEALEQRLKAGSPRSFRIGKQAFEAKFRYEIQTDGSARELYDRALLEKEKLLAHMGVLATGLWPKYFPYEAPPADRLRRISRVIGKLSENHVKAEDFVAEVKRQLPILNQWVADHHLVTLDPSKPLVVRETPEYLRGVAGASCTAPGPYDPAANTYYDVTPVTGSPAAVESYLREYNTYTLQVLNIHEAIPGHYVQLLHANQSPSLVKTIFGNGAMIEGWAVYSERMMLESGYGGNTPEMWLMYSKWNLRVVCNAILDYGIHVLNLPKAQAMDLLVREAFQQDTEAEEKWHRAQVSQVQLSSYFSGFSAIYDLREQLKARQGPAFDLKAFHETLLSFGSAPLKYTRHLMLDPLQP